MQRGSPPENQHATGVWSDTARSFVAVFTAVIVVARAVLAPSPWSSSRSQTLLLPRRVLQTASSRLEVSANPPPPVLVLRHRRRFRRLRRRRAGLARSVAIPVPKNPPPPRLPSWCACHARGNRNTNAPPPRPSPSTSPPRPPRAPASQSCISIATTTAVLPAPSPSPSPRFVFRLLRKSRFRRCQVRKSDLTVTSPNFCRWARNSGARPHGPVIAQYTLAARRCH